MAEPFAGFAAGYFGASAFGEKGSNKEWTRERAYSEARRTFTIILNEKINERRAFTIKNEKLMRDATLSETRLQKPVS